MQWSLYTNDDVKEQNLIRIRIVLFSDPSQAPDLEFSDGPYGSNSKVKVSLHAINRTRWGGTPYGYHLFYKPVANMTVEENNTRVDEWDLSTYADENGFL